MSLTIYGTHQSRTKRVLWAAAELGLDFDHVPLAWDDPILKGVAFLRLNPAGAVPTIVDDGFALSESLAINLYLAKRYGADGGAPLYPATLRGEAEAWRWSLWVQAHLEPWVQRDVLLANLRDVAGPHAAAVIRSGLATLDRALSQRPWLLGEAFGVADLNVAGVLSPSRTEHLDLDPFANIQDWLARCYGRPAAQAVRQKYRD